MIQIELKPEIEARLVAEAHAKGVEPSVYAGSMIERIYLVNGTRRPLRNPEEVRGPVIHRGRKISLDAGASGRGALMIAFRQPGRNLPACAVSSRRASPPSWARAPPPPGCGGIGQRHMPAFQERRRAIFAEQDGLGGHDASLTIKEPSSCTSAACRADADLTSSSS